MIEFGLSLDAVLPEKMPENLTWLMLDAPLLGDPPRWPAQPRTLHRAAAQIAERSLCRLAPAENLRLRLDFLAALDRRLAAAAEARVETARLDCDLVRADRDPAYREQLLTLLRAMGGLLEDRPLRLELGVRLPQEGLDPARLLALLRELPNRNILPMLEIHPHEPGAAALSPALFRLLGHEAEALEFVYEPALGNRLTAKLLTPILRALPATPRRRIFFHPAGLEADAANAEAEALAELAEELKRALSAAAG